MAKEFFKNFNNVHFERGNKCFQTKYAVLVNFKNQASWDWFNKRKKHFLNVTDTNNTTKPSSLF